MQQLNFKIEEFEGPLDLLLVLISKNKMKILEIEIFTIISQYLEVINEAQQQNLDIASDFIDMAARLIYLKSVYLLPKDDEGEKLKQELQGQLIEYSQAKQASEYFRTVYIGDNIFTREEQEIVEDLTYTIVHPIAELINAYSNLSDKALRKSPPTTEKFQTIVNAPVVSVQSKLFSLLKGMMKNSFNNINDAFKGMKNKSETVATFLALLELLKANRIQIDTDGQMRLNKKRR